MTVHCGSPGVLARRGAKPWQRWPLVELTALLDVLDRTDANLTKLEAVWARGQSFMPTGPSAGSDPEYDDLCRSWTDLLSGLPPIDGWTISEQLPDIDGQGRAFLDWAEIGNPHGRCTRRSNGPARTSPSTATASTARAAAPSANA